MQRISFSAVGNKGPLSCVSTSGIRVSVLAYGNLKRGRLSSELAFYLSWEHFET